MDKRLIYRNILLEQQFSEFADCCRRYGVRLTPLKGMGLLLEGVYKEGERDMEDIDILIRKKDVVKVEKIFNKIGYHQVKSGEMGYYRKGHPAVIDIHTDILYMNSGQLRNLWSRMNSKIFLSLLPPVEHFLYILAHSFIQHGRIRKSWKEDLNRLFRKISGPEIIVKKARSYGLNVLLSIYNCQIFNLNHPSLKSRYVKFVLSLPAFPEKGHFIRPVFAGNFKEKFKFFKNFFFPNLKFLKRRYSFRPVELLFYFRPFMLVFKIIKTPIY